VTAEINFFCMPQEELAVLRHVIGSSDIVAFDRSLAAPQTIPTIDATAPPRWPAPFACFLWLRSAGPLRWHAPPPVFGGATPGDRVQSLIANLNWTARPPAPEKAMLDSNMSPVLMYRRGSLDGEAMGPCRLISMPAPLNVFRRVCAVGAAQLLLDSPSLHAHPRLPETASDAPQPLCSSSHPSMPSRRPRGDRLGPSHILDHD
jgi:hypothetical protein